MGFRVQGSGSRASILAFDFGVQGSVFGGMGFGDWGLGFRVRGLRFGVWGLGFWLGSGVSGFGFRVIENSRPVRHPPPRRSPPSCEESLMLPLPPRSQARSCVQASVKE